MTGPLTVARPPAGGARRPRLPAAPVNTLTGPTRDPSVAPDGSAVAFIVDESGYPRGVQQFLDGTSVRDGRYVTLPVEGPITKVVHSPDGRWLACAVLPHAGDRAQVWAVTTDPTDRRAIWVDGSGAETAELVGWDEDRVAITVEGPDCVGEARLVDPSTGAAHELGRAHGLRLVDSWQGSALVRLGPRGDRHLRLLHGNHEIPLFDADTGSTSDPARILREPGALPGEGGFPSRVRVLVRTDHGSDRLRLVEVTVTEGDVSHRVIAERHDADLDEFVVSTDRSTVAVLWNVAGGLGELEVLDYADGEGPVRARPRSTLPGPVAAGLSISDDASVLAMGVSGPARPPCVELLDLRRRQWMSLAAAPGEPDAVVPTVERYTARDGLQLSGWWYEPAGATLPGPVLIWLHGGPEAQSRPEHSDVLPTILAAGYRVFAPNVRGSGGFGRAFSHADDVEKRMRSIEDVEDTVAHLVRRGLADPGRVVCSGRSYGGYLTNAMLAFRPGLFVGGISICGMSEFASFYEETEPWIAAAAVSKYGDPVADADLLREVSPIHRVENIRVPMLIVHGASDTNVPVGESRRMAEAVRSAGGRADLLVVPGEGHDFTQPHNRALLARRMRDFVREVAGPAEAPAAETEVHTAQSD